MKRNWQRKGDKEEEKKAQECEKFDKALMNLKNKKQQKLMELSGTLEEIRRQNVKQIFLILLYIWHKGADRKLYK